MAGKLRQHDSKETAKDAYKIFSSNLSNSLLCCEFGYTGSHGFTQYNFFNQCNQVVLATQPKTFSDPTEGAQKSQPGLDDGV